MGAPTGDPCAKDCDCAGSRPTCMKQDAQGTPFAGGYCTSSCDPAMNDPTTTVNAACPGTGTCIGLNGGGVCYRACTATGGMRPCTRSGYACFVGMSGADVCLPASRSQCDPTVADSCAQDGGVAEGCVAIGPDPVGKCVPECDLFAQNCGAGQGCYASYAFGFGVCAAVFMAGTDGASCMYTNSCSAGFACHGEPTGSFCRPFCGGPANVACAAGDQKKVCVTLSSTSPPTSVVGVCGG
jgi:hypothetical protein